MIIISEKYFSSMCIHERLCSQERRVHFYTILFKLLSYITVSLVFILLSLLEHKNKLLSIRREKFSHFFGKRKQYSATSSRTFLVYISRSVININQLRGDRLIGLVGRMLANSPGDRGSITGRVMPKT